MKKPILFLTMLIGFSAFVFNSCSKSSYTATPAAVSPAAGNWGMNNGNLLFTLSLNADNTYGLVANGYSQESGAYTWADTSVTFNATSTGGNNCGKGPGKYTYKITGTAITFKLFSDSCAVRKGYIVGTWNRQ